MVKKAERELSPEEKQTRIKNNRQELADLKRRLFELENEDKEAAKKAEALKKEKEKLEKKLEKQRKAAEKTDKNLEIGALEEELRQLNEREQKPYDRKDFEVEETGQEQTVKAYKVVDRRFGRESTEPDVEKLVAEREQKIHDLEMEIERIEGRESLDYTLKQKTKERQAEIDKEKFDYYRDPKVGNNIKNEEEKPRNDAEEDDTEDADFIEARPLEITDQNWRGGHNNDRGSIKRLEFIETGKNEPKETSARTIEVNGQLYTKEALENQLPRLKQELEEKQKEYEKKKSENDGFAKKFKLFFAPDTSLWQSKKEEESLKKEFEKKSEQFSGLEEALKDFDLAVVKQKLSRARQNFLEADYKQRKLFNRIGTGGREAVAMVKGKNGNEIVDQDDVNYLRAVYENEAVNYKNTLLEDAKKEGITPEKIAEIAKKINLETNLELADERSRVVLAHHEGRFTGKTGEMLKNISEWYTKLPLKYKLAVGGAIGLSAWTAGALGATTVASYLGVAALGRRIAFGAITGTGMAIKMENRSQSKRLSNAEKESQEFSKNVEFFGYDEKDVSAKLNEKIFSVDQNIKGIKNKNLRILTYGTLIGSFISSGMASVVLERMGITGFVSKELGQAKDYLVHLAEKAGIHFNHADVVGHAGAEPVSKISQSDMPNKGFAPVHYDDGKGLAGHTNVQPSPQSHGAVEAPAKSGAASIKEAPAESGAGGVKEAPPAKGGVGKTETGGLVAEQAPQGSSGVDLKEKFKEGLDYRKQMEGGSIYKEKVLSPRQIDLEIQKGSSFEGTIIKSLQEQGFDKKEAGKMAHKMALAYAKEHDIPFKKLNLVHPNAEIKIEVSPGGKYSVAEFHDSPPSEWNNVHETAGNKGIHHHETPKTSATNPVEHKVSAAKNFEAGTRHSVPPPDRNFAGSVAPDGHYEGPPPPGTNPGVPPDYHPNPASAETVVAQQYVPGLRVKIVPAYDFYYHPSTVFLRTDWTVFRNVVGRYGFRPHDSVPEIIGKTLRAIAGNRDDWHRMQPYRFDQVREAFGARVHGRIDKVARFHEAVLGHKARPHVHESLRDWTRRLYSLSEKHVNKYHHF